MQYQSNNVSNIASQKFEQHSCFSRDQQVRSEKVSKTNIPPEEILPQHQPRPPEEILLQPQPRPPDSISLKYLEQPCNSKYRHFGFWY